MAEPKNRQLTKPKGGQLAKRPDGKLTQKMEGWCLSVIGGMGYSDAYRANYSTTNMKQKVINNKASLLASRGDVGVRLKELRAELVAKVLWTRAESILALVDIVKSPEKDSDAIAAVRALNAMHGYDAPAQLEVTHRLLVPSRDEDWL
jgi:hypothetical protein